MFPSQDLKDHLNKNSNIEIESAVLVELNMNIAENISVIGNYKNRPADSGAVPARTTFELEDENTATKYYYGYTDSDVVIDGGYDLENTPVAFSSINKQKKMLYSLEDCFLKFRPRSGINKAMSFGSTSGHYVHNTNSSMMKRPRYYMGHKDDKFKYWTSHRVENVNGVGEERGISNIKVTDSNQWYIYDTAPFIKYNDAIPTNRVILKMQTHVGTYDLGNYFDGIENLSDPLYDSENSITNRSVPITWRVEYLPINSDTWTELASFDSTDNSTSPLIPRDGYLELHYSKNGWTVGTSVPSSETSYLTELVSPTPVDVITGKYEQFMYMRGLRVVVDTMSRQYVTFDLIEMSPRLACDFSSITYDFSINKVASDLGSVGLPVGQLLASTGSITFADYDQSFNLNNIYNSSTNPNGSVVAEYIGKNMQIKMYEIIKNVDVDSQLTDFYVPIKTMYGQSFPEIDNTTRLSRIALRDLYFYFENLTAPEMFIPDISFSYAISLLFDSIGFSNYVYLKSANDDDVIIPYFYIGPNTTVAEVLQQLARSTQTAMFFDENNNFVLMSKSYMLPSEGDRNSENPDAEIDTVLYGSDDESGDLSNILSVSDQSKDLFNAGKIVYTTRYIQKSYTEMRQAMLLDEEKVWKYKPVLLWEIAGQEQQKSINEEKASQSSYTLSAIPLKTKLSSDVPTVVEVDGIRKIINNTIDLGEAVYWVSRYNGYFYANGEIIRYDAVEYSVPGQDPSNVWINSVEEYQKYFAQIPFGGKMYPTGLVRVYAEPKYESYTGGTRMSLNDVAKHGRAQFGTTIATHNAELGTDHWTQTNVRGMSVAGDDIFVIETSSDGVLTATADIRVTNAAAAGTNTFTINPVDVAKLEKIVTTAGLEVYQKVVGILANRNAIRFNTRVASFNAKKYEVTLSKSLKETLVTNASNVGKGKLRLQTFKNGVVTTTEAANIGNILGPAGTGDGVAATGTNFQARALTSQRKTVMRNFLSSSYIAEKDINSLSATQTGTVQSSALIFTGPQTPVGSSSSDFLTYAYKVLPSDKSFNHFGARMRIIGTPQNGEGTTQIPTGASELFSLISDTPDVDTIISGSSGGIGICVDPVNNFGYFLELAALTTNNIDKYSGKNLLANVFFYKTKRSDETDTPRQNNPAVSIKLWSGLTNIVVDDGLYAGQYRAKGEEIPTVYDVAVEYERIDSKGAIKFYIYINNNLVGTVIDRDALPTAAKSIGATTATQNMAIFVRGESKVMFENIFAMGSMSPGYQSNAALRNGLRLNKESESDDALMRLSIPNSVSAGFLSDLSPIAQSDTNLYFEEFGTIMRECAYLNIKYDKAYPSLISKIAPTFNKIKGYSVSGYVSGPYGAEFLIFNNTDTVLSLDETSGNYLRILGVTFTQESKHDYTLDQHFAASSDFANQDAFAGESNNVFEAKESYQKIKNSRMTYGTNEFALDADYIQDEDTAKNLMSWLSKKVTGKRKSVAIDIFPNPIIQLGDIVTINYKRAGVDQIASESTRFVVYNITYNRNGDGASMTLSLSEVANA